MDRDISTPMLAAVLSNEIVPAILFTATFRSATEYVWTGIGDLVYGGNTYRGIGDLGKISSINEGVQVNADGTQVTLSGIDSTLLGETLTDVQIGAPATIYLALLDPATMLVLGTPYPLFVGTVDQPTVSPGLEEFSITLKLENKLVDLQRANMRRYTAADQRLYFPNDMGFFAVETLNDIALRWGG
jgi:hypothetical protein